MSRARDAAIAAATELFAERGYRQVTIRDIATLAGLSPAMVMKSVGNKQKLFHDVVTVEPLPLHSVPTSELGTALVRDLLDRFHADAVEPMTRVLMLRMTAPDPEPLRKEFVRGYFDPLTERLGGGDEAQLRAELAISALLGLAATLRIFSSTQTPKRYDEVLHRYGALVQQLIDG
jgi:AcrR family transcriptional regulator